MGRAFQFNVEVAIQAVAFLLRNAAAHRMNYMRLIKLLYIAERESLRDAGRPLTGSHTIAMERGPVLEDVFRLIRSAHPDTPKWSSFFQVDGYELVMLKDPGTGRLSQFDREKLEEIADRHARDDEWALVDFTHSLPEWQRNNPEKSSKPIPLSDILDAVGRRELESQIRESARRTELLTSLLANDC